ncbi:MAG: fibronectin type III domain-containing protein, partial [Treponema sp.]|nr:fibronectin type III domain-containing protein [Treponema sp.]
MTVSWDVAKDANSYEIFCSETAAVSGTDTPYRESQFTTVTLDQLENDQIYYIFVRSKNRAGSSALSSPAAGEPVLVAPAPSVIQIDGGLSVCWIADDGVFYEVLYSSGDDPESASVSDTDISAGNIAGITADIIAVARITGLDNSIPYNVWIKAEADGKEVVSEMSSGIFAPVIPGRTVTGSSDYAM